MNFAAFYLGMHAHELSFRELVTVLFLTFFIMMCIDGTLWTVFKLIVHSIKCFLMLRIRRTNEKQMIRMLNKYTRDMEKRREQLKLSREKIEKMQLELGGNEKLKNYNVRLHKLDESHGAQILSLKEQTKKWTTKNI